MRQFLLGLFYLWTVSAMAQQIEEDRQINTVYLADVTQEEKAVKTIESTSKLLNGSFVTYRAGQSVSLKPGFVAIKGSVMSAIIEPISGNNENGMHLVVAPNPVEANTIVEFVVPTRSEVKLQVVDIKGNIIEELVNETLDSGTYQHKWNSARLVVGSYLCLLRAQNKVLAVRIIKQ